MGNEYDYDDLENIFKDQTPPETTNQFEDFFIAKLIANQDEDNKVLVGQVNDKAIGMLSISTDINVNFLIKNFELETYDNLLKPDFMEAVNYKRQLISQEKMKKMELERKQLEQEYEREITKCEKISQRILLQKYVSSEKQVQILNSIDEIEKNYQNKDELNEKRAKDIIDAILNDFNIIYPELEKFDGKIKVTQGECLLSSKFDFFIETLEYFGLPKGYMQKKGHWLDWLEKEAKKREQKEQFRKKLGNVTKHRRREKKDNEEPQQPNYFDFSPLGKSMRLLKDANITIRSWLSLKILKIK